MISFGRSRHDRSARAKTNRRRIQDLDPISDLIPRSRTQASWLKSTTDDELRSYTHRLRHYVQTSHESLDGERLVLASALVSESIRRTLGKEIFDSQLHAGLIVSSGAVAEMQTGEGKTIAGVLPAFIRSLEGRGVHVATTNEYLAKRDHELLSPVFLRLGMTTGLIDDTVTSLEKRKAYRADVTYGPSHVFGFDYLRDQLSRRTNAQERLGDRLISVMTQPQTASQTLQRGLHSAIIDEIDHVLLDDAVTPLLLSGNAEGESPDAEVHREARRWSDRLTIGDDYFVTDTQQIQLTTIGFSRLYQSVDDGILTHHALVRPWHEYVILAIRAKLIYQRNVHYVVRDQRVQLVDGSTGRIFEDRTWSDGLQQAVEAREDVRIRSETQPLGRITRQSFYRQYRFLGGMTGTANGCQREFASTYGLPVKVIQPRLPNRRLLWPDHYSRTIADKYLAIVDETQAMITSGRAVLIGTVNIAESHEIAKQLSSRNLSFELLNGVQDANEATLVAKAGRRHAITVATSLAGRGTDIHLDDDVERAGGLHVIVAQRHSLARLDRQLMGRSARCGDQGSARVFVSAEDPIAAIDAPWIGRAIVRWVDQSGSNETRTLVLDHQWERIQSQHQKTQAVARKRLLISEHEDECLFATTDTLSPHRCWSL